MNGFVLKNDYSKSYRVEAIAKLTELNFSGSYERVVSKWAFSELNDFAYDSVHALGQAIIRECKVNEKQVRPWDNEIRVRKIVNSHWEDASNQELLDWSSDRGTLYAYEWTIKVTECLSKQMDSFLSIHLKDDRLF